jgi:hypothetical protein
MAETPEMRQLRAALGRDLSTRLEVERDMPERLAKLLRKLKHVETIGSAARVER